MKMKQTFLLLLLLLLPLVAMAQGNKVTINAQRQALTAALRQVEQQSGYYKVNYPYEAVKDYQVTASVKNVTAP